MSALARASQSRSRPYGASPVASTPHPSLGMRSPWPRCRIPLAVTASVAALSCGEEPVGPPLDTPGSEEPQLGFSPSPCAGLASGIACLVADLDAISHSASSPSPNYSLWVENWIEGTSAGTLLDAVFCTQETMIRCPLQAVGWWSATRPGWITTGQRPTSRRRFGPGVCRRARSNSSGQFQTPRLP